jgi:hypothetical protein
MEAYQRNGLLLSDTSLPASGLIRPFLDGNLQTLSYIELDEEDVVRHRLVKSIIKAYNKDDERNMKEKEQKEQEKKS